MSFPYAFARPPQLPQPKEPPAKPTVNSRFYAHDLRLLEEGYLSDVKVSCGSTTWNLHKLILCSRCVWFDKALAGNFAEARSGHVVIEEFEPSKVYWMIRYIYTGTLDIEELKSDSSVYTTAIDLYILADYFDFPEMRDEILSYLKSHCDTKAGEIQRRQPQGEALKQILNLEALFDGLKLAFGDTADDNNPVSKIFVEFVHKTRFCLLPNPNFLELMGQVPRFSVAMMRLLYGDQYDMRGARYPSHCSNCGTPPGAGKCFDRIAPITIGSVETRAVCGDCARKGDAVRPIRWQPILPGSY